MDEFVQNVKNNDATILHKKGESGHYIAITDAEMINGEKMVKIKDSTKDHEEVVKFEDIFKLNDTIHYFKV